MIFAYCCSRFIIGKKPDDCLFPVKDVRYAWGRICKAAGVVPGRKGFIIHDARRTSARAKRAAGIDTSITMAVMGWKSEAMFRRYGIVDVADTRAALERQSKWEKALSAPGQLQSAPLPAVTD